MAARVAPSAYSINNFPDEVLCGIISFLPFKEAVRTSVLSRRWRHLFTLMKDLEFDMGYSLLEEDKFGRIWKFFDRLVLLKDLRSILRFCFRSCGDFDPQRIIRWIHALVENNIQELDICGNCGFGLHLPLPQSLFSCESLVILKLDFRWSTFDFEVPARFCLPNLKVLHFQGIGFSSDGSEERLFSSCPVLEDVVLYECYIADGCLEFNVSNQNLKRLKMKLIAPGRSTVPIPININTPSLVLLDYAKSEFDTPVFIDVKSLVEAAVTSTLYAPVPDSLSWIQNFRTLKISEEVLREVRDVPIPLLEKLTCLKICDWDWERISYLDSLENILASCVALETLIFEECDSLPVHQHKGIEFDDSFWNPTSLCLLSHLKTIEIQSSDFAGVEVLMTVIKFFLENAMVLEVLKIHHKGGHREEAKIKRMLSSFPRASKKCRILL